MEELAEKAAQLRRDGVGVKRIARELGVSHHRVMVWLRDVPLPSSVPRPRTQDGMREAALLLRAQGRTYTEIRDELGVSKGTLSLSLRDLAMPSDAQRSALASREAAVPPDHVETDQDIARALRVDGWLLREIAEAMGIALKTAFLWTRGIAVPPRAMHGRSPEEARAMGRAYWDGQLAEREVARQRLMSDAADWVGELSPREVELVAVTAYWCEGTKSKPWRPHERLTFINSDPDLIRLWLRWLRQCGVGPDRLGFRVNIHESADVLAATEFWADVVGCAPEDFAPPTLKRHNPRTIRKNTGEHYRG